MTKARQVWGIDLPPEARWPGPGAWRGGEVPDKRRADQKTWGQGAFMLTPDELAAIPIFSSLSPAALADVARTAADMYLNVGEYAVYEDEPPALFVVIEGTIEVIKLVDGVERKLGRRLAGTLFGEIPLVFGTQFQAGFRASEPTRVLKLDASPYYHVAASSPELVRSMDALAR